MYVTQANRYDCFNAPLVNNILTTLGSHEPSLNSPLQSFFLLNVITTLQIFLLFFFFFPNWKTITTIPL